MKALKTVAISCLFLILAGCVVFSFYPLYTEKDLFPNDILTGKWVDSDSAVWIFEHPLIDKNIPGIFDTTSYVLSLTDKESKESRFNVHIIKLNGNYFLDFYLDEYFNGAAPDLAAFHLLPVHTFAKLSAGENELKINWFDQNWLEKGLRENKIRIRHEKSSETILLTAKPAELQKFVVKYANTAEAFKDGLEVILRRN